MGWSPENTGIGVMDFQFEGLSWDHLGQILCIDSLL